MTRPSQPAREEELQEILGTMEADILNIVGEEFAPKQELACFAMARCWPAIASCELSDKGACPRGRASSFFHQDVAPSIPPFASVETTRPHCLTTRAVEELASEIAVDWFAGGDIAKETL